ncbi:MAG TPA: hypothetical protein VH682_03355 [Gemmataceae bacterium]|jgi:hypothetical protein
MEPNDTMLYRRLLDGIDQAPVNPRGDEDACTWDDLLRQLRGWAYLLDVAEESLASEFTPVVNYALARADLIDDEEDEDEDQAALGVPAAPIATAAAAVVAELPKLPPGKRPYWEQ